MELGAVEGQAWIDPDDRTPAEGSAGGRFHLLRESVDYWYFPITAWGRPMLELREPLPPDHTLAVTYREVIAPGDTAEVGSVSPPPPGGQWQLKIDPSPHTDLADLRSAPESLGVGAPVWKPGTSTTSEVAASIPAGSTSGSSGIWARTTRRIW